MAILRPLAAVAAVALVQTVSGWHIELPPCLSPFRPFVYTGCFEDLHSPNALTYRSSQNTQNMTVEKCVAECKGNGFRYAGLEYYGECYCGATVNGKQASSPSQCSFACTGNSSQVCGGNDRISVYQDPTFPVSDDVTINNYVPLGCYTDNSPLGKTLAWRMDNVDPNTLTPEKCLTACKAQGYPFAGTEYSRKSPLARNPRPRPNALLTGELRRMLLRCRAGQRHQRRRRLAMRQALHRGCQQEVRRLGQVERLRRKGARVPREVRLPAT